MKVVRTDVMRLRVQFIKRLSSIVKPTSAGVDQNFSRNLSSPFTSVGLGKSFQLSKTQLHYL